MTDDNLAYYQRRAQEEAEAAASATSSEAASAHRLLATQYEAEARELASRSGSAFVKQSHTVEET